MLQDRVSNPGPLTYESGALPIALRDLAALITLGGIKVGTFHVTCCILFCFRGNQIRQGNTHVTFYVV